MKSFHRIAAELNDLEARVQALSRELLKESRGKSWQWVHIRKVELDELDARRARLLALLS